VALERAEPHVYLSLELVHLRLRRLHYRQASETGGIRNVLAIDLHDFLKGLRSRQPATQRLPVLFDATADEIHCWLGKFRVVEHELAKSAIADQPPLPLDFIVVIHKF